ncbi:MAG: hypothetical protein NVS9B1_14630 [Candidatus Dormibacteraceae bacterium]
MLAMASLLALAATIVGSTASAAAPTGSASVIVRAEPGAALALEHATVRLGGSITHELAIINGFSATMPAAAVTVLRGLPGVVAVTPDRAANFHSLYDPTTDAYSIAAIAQGIGATQAYAGNLTGAGVDIALLDTGVTPVAGLNGAGKIVNGPDFSLDLSVPGLRHLDAYGHGTFMAGLIAGQDAGANPAAPGAAYVGIAPGARIVNVKAGSATGLVDIAQIIAGIDWVIKHRRDGGLNIRVLNLSVGTDSAQDYGSDPLAFAAETAWKQGIVVVAAAGNGGAALGRLDDPAIDPFVIAVGAEAPANGLAAAYVPAFSSTGDGVRNPDFIAPGIHVQGLRVPGSYIDVMNPSAVLGTRFFRGSGTSEAAAIVSGSVALLLQHNPSLSPDQVKAALKQTAKPLPGVPATRQGSGLIGVGAALSSPLPLVATQLFAGAAGAGSLEKGRGSHHITSNGVALTGEKDVLGNSFGALDLDQSYGGGGWNGTTWNGTTWRGTTWSGTTWSGTTWSGTTWSGTTWRGTTWSGTTWSGTTWAGTTWAGTTWDSGLWAGGSWD